jgi:hypothetical protein
MRKRKTEKWAAKITIKDGAKMTRKGRKQVAKWMERQAKFLREDGDLLAPTYTARYLYA